MFVKYETGNIYVKIFKMEPEKKKNPKQPKRDSMKHKSVPLTKILPSNCVEDTAKKIKELYLAGSIDKISNVVVEFLHQCINKHREVSRETTMALTDKIHRLFNADTNTLVIIEQIILGFEKFFQEKENNEQFVIDVFNGHVHNNSWKSSFIDAVKLDVLKHFDTLDKLYHLTKFDNYTQEKYAYNYICRLHSDEKTKNNALEWMKKLNFNFEKSNLKECTTTLAEKSEWMEMVQKTAQNLHNLYSDSALNKIPTCIAEFYSNCSKEWLRSATMDLIYNTNELLCSIEKSDPSLIIYHIFICFQDFLNERGKEFSKNVFLAEVSDNLWKKSIKDAFELRCAVSSKNESLEILPALDLLYKIHQPENETRKKFIFDSVQKLMCNKKTYNMGEKRVKALKLDLDDFKINHVFDVVDQNNRPWLKYAQEMHDEFQKFEYNLVNCLAALNVFYFNSNDKRLINPRHVEKIQKSKPDVEISVKTCPLEFLRPATMELLIMVDRTKETSKNLIYNICKKYSSAVGAHARFIIATVKVFDELWLGAWKVSIENRKLRDLRTSAPIEALFRINAPETDDRKDVIHNAIRKMLSKNDTFYTAIPWINKYRITKLKEEQFGHVKIYEAIFQNGIKTYFEKHPLKKDRIKYLNDLDKLLQQVANGTLRAEKKAITTEKLLDKVCKLAESLKIDMEEYNLYASQASFIRKTKDKFECFDRSYFELYIVEYLKPREYKYKVLFLQSILIDKNYAYCWAKYFEIKERDMPNELKPYSYIVSEDDLLKFKNKINKIVHIRVDKDHVETCKIWGRPYKLITIFTPNGLHEFVDEYFIKSKPKIIGLDIETGKAKEAVVFQIGTHDCLCLIYIQELFDKLTKDEWIKFFEIIFNPDILRVGFAFHNDFGFLCNKFPYLQNLFQKEQKVLCLQKLANYLIKENIIVEDFCTELYADSALAKLTKAVLYLNMDKSLQTSDWVKGFLTQFQKLYAVIDALLVVLLKDDIQQRLEREYTAEKVLEIMEKGYIYYEKPPPAPAPSPTKFSDTLFCYCLFRKQLFCELL